MQNAVLLRHRRVRIDAGWTVKVSVLRDIFREFRVIKHALNDVLQAVDLCSVEDATFDWARRPNVINSAVHSKEGCLDRDMLHTFERVADARDSG
jgi:hypothetical protein